MLSRLKPAYITSEEHQNLLSVGFKPKLLGRSLAQVPQQSQGTFDSLRTIRWRVTFLDSCQLSLWLMRPLIEQGYCWVDECQEIYMRHIGLAFSLNKNIVTIHIQVSLLLFMHNRSSKGYTLILAIGREAMSSKGYSNRWMRSEGVLPPSNALAPHSSRYATEKEGNSSNNIQIAVNRCLRAWERGLIEFYDCLRAG